MDIYFFFYCKCYNYHNLKTSNVQTYDLEIISFTNLTFHYYYDLRTLHNNNNNIIVL